jgi:ADP-ribose pyrophosphatase YjhB (NUDIX family)
MNEVRRRIFKRFMYSPKLKYNEIWDKELCRSNVFDYHLKQLVQEDVVRKEGEHYLLTPKGVRLISELDGEKIELGNKPIVCVFVLGEKDGKYLLNIRRKQPFIDLLGIPGGKVEFGTGLQEQAEREFMEETGLSGDMKLRYVVNFITHEGDSTSHHMTGFYYLATDLRGELIEKTREGENLFLSVDEMDGHRKYPDMPGNIEAITSSGDGIVFREAHRYVEDGEFVKIEYVE